MKNRFGLVLGIMAIAGCGQVGLGHSLENLEPMDVIWEFAKLEDGSATTFPAVAVDGTVYFRSENGVVHAVDGVTGEKKWGRGSRQGLMKAFNLLQ